MYIPWLVCLVQVVDIALRMTKLHYQYSPLIISLARQATTNGYPINRPLWWIDPTDPVAQTIESGNALSYLDTSKDSSSFIVHANHIDDYRLAFRKSRLSFPG